MRNEVCPRCGTTEADWVDPTTHQPRDDPPWEATTWRCFGCAEMDSAQKEVPQGEPGVRVLLTPAYPGNADG